MSGFWKCVLYAAALALLAHPLGQAIPGPFDPEKRLFRSRKWEQNGRIYTKLAIDKWKKLVPDMSRILPDMVKKELPGSGAVTADQAAALVQETCRAELVHGASCLLGLAFLWLWPGWGGVAVEHGVQWAGRYDQFCARRRKGDYEKELWPEADFISPAGIYHRLL